MKKILLFILSSLVTLDLHAATNASPGQKWYGPYTITKVARYWDGGGRATVHFAETPIDIPCDINKNQRKAAYWGDPNAHAFADSMFSVAATANAQNKKVYVLLDKSCHPLYGLNLHGIEMVSD